MAAQKHTYGDGPGAIYGETANINYFLNTSLAPDSAVGVTNKTSNVKAHNRRRYVSDDTPSNVSSSTREFLSDPGRRNGGATPGKPMVLSDGIERRQFSYTGDFMDLHAFILGEAKMALTLYSQSAAYDIAGPLVEN